MVCFSSSMLPYLRGRGLEDRTVVDLVDADSEKWLDYAGHARVSLSWLFRREANRVQMLEEEAGRNRSVTLVTQREAALYRKSCTASRVEVISNGVDLNYFTTPVPRVHHCVFVGQLDYRANVMGLKWFCSQVWPLVRRGFPRGDLFDRRKKSHAHRRHLARCSGVEVVGPVQDVRPSLAAASIVVAPLLVARGIQNKVLEAMSAARPTIVSPAVLRGLQAVADQDLLFGRNARPMGRPISAALVRREASRGHFRKCTALC